MIVYATAKNFPILTMKIQKKPPDNQKYTRTLP